mmetsp:Transcript_26958/g.63042  ORF Transcript_26958/g.63042 Transcript_26958/m.63042 type:complete len:89 (-) Transcript_26958:201-467(-)
MQNRDLFGEGKKIKKIKKKYKRFATEASNMLAPSFCGKIGLKYRNAFEGSSAPTPSFRKETTSVTSDFREQGWVVYDYFLFVHAGTCV